MIYLLWIYLLWIRFLHHNNSITTQFILKVSGGAGGYSPGRLFSDPHCLVLHPIPYNIYPQPPPKGGARIFCVDSAADVLKCAKIITRFFRTFHFGSENFVRRYT